MSQSVPHLMVVSISVVKLILHLPNSVEGGILGGVGTSMHEVVVILLLLEMVGLDR